MRRLRLLAILTMLLQVPAGASAAESPDELLPLDEWVAAKVSALTDGCKALKPEAWVKRYSQMSLEVMNEMKTLDAATFEEHDPDGPLREFVSSVFPQHVPQAKQRDANLCFSDLWAFTKAKTAKARAAASRAFADCNHDRYAGEIPKPVVRLLSCWKQLKK